MVNRFYASSESNNWFTTMPIIYAAKRVMGGIQLDPATCREAQDRIKADHYFFEEDDGLSQDWSQFGVNTSVFCNPPQGWITLPGSDKKVSQQGAWARTFAEKWYAGEIAEGILLVNANTSEKWFQHLFQFPICFVDGRIHFDAPQGHTISGPTKGNAIIYFGHHLGSFKREFSAFGNIMETSQARKPYPYDLDALFCDNCGSVIEPGAKCDNCGNI